MARKKAATQGTTSAAPNVLVPLVTTFDFLEGAFARSERARVAGLALIGATAVALAVVLALGGMNRVEVLSATGDLSRATDGLSTVSAQLGTLDQAEGIPAATISAHLTEQSAALKQVVGKELDTVAVLRSIWDTAPAGITVTAVTVLDTPATTTATKTADAPAAGAAPAGAFGGITITAQAAGLAAIPAWSQALSALPGLSGVDVAWSGGGDSVAVTVTAALTQAAASQRSLDAGAAVAATTGAGSTGQGVVTDTGTNGTSANDLLGELPKGTR